MFILDFIKAVFRKPKDPNTFQERSLVYGNAGRLEIKDLNISVPVYDTKIGSAQSVIDANDSAVYLNWGNQFAIADHANQGNFSNLNHVVVGKTEAILDRRVAKERFVCVGSQIGHIKTENGVNTIFDSKWQFAYIQNPGGLTIYTCIERSSENVMDVRLTYWQPLWKIQNGSSGGGSL